MKQADIAWWYWLFTVSLLGAGLFGWFWGLFFAIALCMVQIGHVFWITRNVAAFAMQVRLVYLTMLIAGLCGPLKWLHWVQLVGTTARVLIGYCFLARTFSLAVGAFRVTPRASWRISSSISKGMTISSRICVETRRSSSDRSSSGE